MRFFPIALPAILLLTAAVTTGNVVRYRDFGAKGDGKTDDFDSFIAAHQHANAKGLPVKADDGATYYLGRAAKTIPIRTSTDFGKARFIIDDTNPEDSGKHVFEITCPDPPVPPPSIPPHLLDHPPERPNRIRHDGSPQPQHPALRGSPTYK